MSPSAALHPDAAHPESERPGAAAIGLAGLALVEEVGLDAATADRIARRAGVSRRTFFRYFPVKEDVLFFDHVELLAALRRRLGGGAAAPVATAGDALQALVDALVGTSDLTRRRAALVERSAVLREREVLWHHACQDEIGAYLGREARTDHERDFAPLVAAALLAAVREVLTDWLACAADHDPRARFRELADEITASMSGRHARQEPADADQVLVVTTRLSASRVATLLAEADR